SGTLLNGAKIDGVAGLRRELSAQPEVFVGVMTEKMLTYALGRGIEYYDMPAVRKIVQDGRSRDFKFSSVVVGIAKSLPFQRKEAKARESAAVGREAQARQRAAVTKEAK